GKRSGQPSPGRFLFQDDAAALVAQSLVKPNETFVSAQKGVATFVATRAQTLLRNDQDHERIRLHFAAPLARGRWIKVRGGEKDVMGLQIEPHGAGAPLGGDVFYHGVFVGRVLVDHGDYAFAAGSEEIVRGRVERGGIGAVANCRCGDDLAGVRIHDDRDFVITNSEQAAVFHVHRKARWRLAWRKRPVVEFLKVL